jgi:type IV pilus assembly protein PilY1
MLVAGKDHKLFYEAYNDTSDLDGDGNYDIRFNPRIEYYGLFDSKLCYKGKGKNTSGTLVGTTYSASADYFYPDSAVKNMELKTCSGAWSGNFLNYVTTSRMDALRKVLYGGHRGIDSATQTILRRAYVPRDAHGWGKEYTSVAVDGYNIADYTTLSVPTLGKRHFFGGYTMLLSCNLPATCRDKSAPVLAVAKNASSTKRVWDWAAAEASNLFNDVNVGVVSSDRSKYVVQVEACGAAFTLPDGTKNYRGDNCKPYTNKAGNTVFKPTGLLHKFGEDGSMLFGLLSGSYNKNLSGGALRKTMSSFAQEVNPETGVFTNNATIVQTFDRLMIRSFQYSGTNDYKNHGGGSSWISNRIMKEGEFVDWGNPVAEMMYEALRYLGGTGAATSDFATSGSHDGAVGLPNASWDNPYASTSAAKAPWCSKPSILVLSDINPSFDSDQLPGAKFKSCSTVTGALTNSNSCNIPGGTGFGGTFGALNVGALTDFIGEKEGINGRSYFIGQSGNDVNWAPTAKSVASLSTIRGLAPEEPGKEGSYYSAAVAYYGKKDGIQTAAGKDKQKVDTYVVALASPLPKIEVPTPKGVVTIVPFGKSVKWNSDISADMNSFQPANQIVEFYIKDINPKDPNNGGRYSATFQISYEDMEQGADHDMDVIAEYEVKQNADSTVTVKVTPTYQSAGITLNVGYNISGTTQDGPYLVVQSRNDVPPIYYLNVPDGSNRAAGWCIDAASDTNDKDDSADMKAKKAACKALPACTSGAFGACTLSNRSSTRTFTPQVNANAAALLKDPLWYAAKWGGFRDWASDKDHWPNTSAKWDANNDGTPDNYFLVRNALGLQAALEKALDSIKEGAFSSSGIDISSETISSDTLAFSTQYNPADWSGDLIATSIVPVSENNPNGIGPVKWRAAANLPAPNARRIFTRINANTDEIGSVGVEFRWTNLSLLLEDVGGWDLGGSLAGAGKFSGENVVNYLRGSIDNEIVRDGAFRNRTRVTGSQSPLGDSPHNEPRYVKATETVYLGANDGMLHAFDAKDGKELFAYVPSALLPKLPKLTDVKYGHEYYVDGDAEVAAVESSLYLVGALGRGGRGLYGLDVTNPSSFSNADVKWEFNGVGDPIQCSGNAAAAADRDNIGFVLSKPLIARLNDGKTYAIASNGYNSCYGKAALYILDIKTGAVKKRLDTPVSGLAGNGLSAPTTLDVNGDGTVDIVYAGDLAGRLWRFDLSSATPGDWKTGVGAVSGIPLFSAVFSDAPQPITAAPVIVVDSKVEPPRTYVLFGTGRYLNASDKASKNVQTFYGIVDSGNATITRASLKARAIEQVVGNTRVISGGTVDDMDGSQGWYIDLKSDGDGERVINAGVVSKVRLGAVAVFPSIIPIENDPCSSGGYSYLNAVNAYTGAALDFPFLDLNGDGVVNNEDQTKVGGKLVTPGSLKVGSGLIGNLKITGDGKQLVYGLSDGTLGSEIVGGGETPYRGRISWRELSD